MNKKRQIYEQYIKRWADVALSVLALVVFCWLYLIIALLVKLKLGSPVLFKQPRPGKHEKIFTMYKFRTMTDERDRNGELLPDEMRLTSFGKALRATSLDELPEIFNIIKGDMSIVGPRPLLVKYLPLYSNEEHRRHEVRPGLTGYAQVMGRNGLSWEQRFRYDLDYVDNVSISRDVLIIVKTVVIAVERKNISAKGAATMQEFKGSGSSMKEVALQ